MADLTKQEILGYFGNIWVKSHTLQKAGDTNGGGHIHHFDHVTLLVKGSVRVEVGSNPPKDFHAPTFIVIRRDKKHRFTALEDDTIYYCVFALRDIDGQPIGDIVDPRTMPNYTPYYSGIVGTPVGDVPLPSDVPSLTPPENVDEIDLEWLKGHTIVEVLGDEESS